MCKIKTERASDRQKVCIFFFQNVNWRATTTRRGQNFFSSSSAFLKINCKPVAKVRFVLVLAFLRNSILNRESRSTVRKVCPKECMYYAHTLTNSQIHSHIHSSLIYSLVYSLIRCPKILWLPKFCCFQNPVASKILLHLKFRGT